MKIFKLFVLCIPFCLVFFAGYGILSKIHLKHYRVCPPVLLFFLPF